MAEGDTARQHGIGRLGAWGAALVAGALLGAILGALSDAAWIGWLVALLVFVAAGWALERSLTGPRYSPTAPLRKPKPRGGWLESEAGRRWLTRARNRTRRGAQTGAPSAASAPTGTPEAAAAAREDTAGPELERVGSENLTPVTEDNLAPPEDLAKPVENRTAPQEPEVRAHEGLAAPEGSAGTLGRTQPPVLDGPRGGVGDDLKRLRGVGPKLEAQLNRMGYHHFDQLAAWTPAEVAWMDAQPGLNGRPSRDDWVGQARALCSGHAGGER